MRVDRKAQTRSKTQGDPRSAEKEVEKSPRRSSVTPKKNGTKSDVKSTITRIQKSATALSDRKFFTVYEDNVIL